MNITTINAFFESISLMTFVKIALLLVAVTLLAVIMSRCFHCCIRRRSTMDWQAKTLMPKMLVHWPERNFHSMRTTKIVKYGVENSIWTVEHTGLAFLEQRAIEPARWSQCSYTVKSEEMRSKIITKEEMPFKKA